MMTILLADDEAIELKYLKRLFLRHSEYKVVGEAQNGIEIIELSSKMHPDVIIMDINMPMMNGLEAAHKIKNKFPNTIIILNTAYADFEFAKKALDYSLDAYLLKPAKEQQIIDTMKSCCNRTHNYMLTNSSYENALISDNFEESCKTIDILKKFIDQNYCREIKLEELAELVHFTPSYISRLFHQETGQTLISYINKIKINKAKQFLLKTERSIQEIAQASGFNNVSHFNRTFKQITTMAPLQYRHYIQNNNR